MTAAGYVSAESGRLGAVALGRLARAADAGLPAEPVRAVADAACSWRGGSCSDAGACNDDAGDAGASGFSVTGVASSHVRVAVVLDRLASLPWLTERDARVEHERRHERHDTVQRRHVHRHRRLQPERRCEMIDRINGRLALLLAVSGLLVVVLAGWFVFVSPQSSKAAALDSQIGDANVQLATTQAFLQSPAAHQSVADLRRLRRAIPDDVEMSEILRQLAWASRASGVRIESITPSAAGSVDRRAGCADRPLGQGPLLPAREVHAPAPARGRGQGRQGARVRAALRHRQHRALDRRQGRPDHGDARARRVRRPAPRRATEQPATTTTP